jgi:hypothetical protein
MDAIKVFKNLPGILPEASASHNEFNGETSFL